MTKIYQKEKKTDPFGKGCCAARKKGLSSKEMDKLLFDAFADASLIFSGRSDEEYDTGVKPGPCVMTQCKSIIVNVKNPYKKGYLRTHQRMLDEFYLKSFNRFYPALCV